MEPLIRKFSDHYTALVLDVELKLTVLCRAFNTEQQARKWLAVRGFTNVDVYDWTKVY